MKMKSENTEFILGLLDQESAKNRQIFIYRNITELKSLMVAEKVVGEILSDINPITKIPFQKQDIIKRSISNSQNNRTIINQKLKVSYTQRLFAIAATLILVINFSLFHFNQKTTTNYSYAALSSPRLNSSWFANLQGDKLSLVPVNSYQKESGSDFELWAVTDNNQVISLGVIPQNKIVYLDLNKFILNNEANIIAIAISKEDEGGSITGKPQGEIFYNSNLQKLHRI